MVRYREMILVVAIGFLFYLLPYVWPTMPKELAYSGISICVLVLIGVILSYSPIWHKFFKKIPITTPSTVNDISGISYDKICKIEQQEPSKRPPIFLNVALVLSWSVMLAFGGLLIYLWIDGKLNTQISLSLLLSPVIFIALPIWVLVDTLWLARKHYTLDKSSVAKDKKIILLGDIKEVFDGCLGVLDIMKATPIIMEKPKLFKGHLRSWFGNSIITVKTNRVRGNKVRIYVLSDSQWVTVRWDIWNVNQRNINTFEQLIRSKLSNIDNTNKTFEAK